jgi:hypothetical protein
MMITAETEDDYRRFTRGTLRLVDGFSVLCRAVSTRASLVFIGLVCGWLAWTTHYGYTVHELPGRDFLVVFLVMMFVCGVAAGILRPTRTTRVVIGIGLVVHSTARGLLLYIADPHVKVNSALPVHILLLYVGLLITVDTYRRPERGDGAS